MGTCRLGAEHADKFDTIHPWHFIVHQDQIHRMVPRPVKCFLWTGKITYIVIPIDGADDFAQDLPTDHLIIDDENSSHAVKTI